MIDLVSLSPEASEAALSTPGGFAWWYMDLVNPEGDGLVLIWSFGLPFLPGSRECPLPSARPSLNLATYRAGKPDFYLLQEYPAEAAKLSHTGAGSLGDSSFVITREGELLALEIILDAPIPASSGRVQGKISLEGPGLCLDGSSTRSAHAWSPQTAMATGSAELDCGGTSFRARGSAYFDANTSAVPLHDQGISSWRWGRLSFADETLVYYDIQGDDGKVSSHVYRQGGCERESSENLTQMSDFSLEPGKEERGLFGLSTPRRYTAGAGARRYDICLSHLVDDGPFYQRFLAEAVREDGARGYGVCELVVPARIDQPWQRPFVRMRTHQMKGENSLWLPLFSGSKRDRLSRLTRTLSERLGP